MIDETSYKTRPATRRRAAAAGKSSPQTAHKFTWRRTALMAVCAFVGGSAAGVVIARQSHHRLDPVARVNGVPIDRELFRRRLDMQPDTMRAVDVMIEDQLAVQFAKRRGVYPTEAHAQALDAESRRQPDFARTLAAAGDTEDDVKRANLIRLVRVNCITKGEQASDQEARRYYAVNTDPANPKARYYTPEGARIEAVITSSRIRAEEANQALHRGMRFGTVAAKYNDGAGKLLRGVLPPIFRGRTRFASIPGFEAAIFSMVPGQTTAPLQLGGAWWIVRCLARSPAQTRSFADVEQDCKLGAALDKLKPEQTARVEQEFADFKAHANLQAFDMRYSSLARR